MKPLTAITKAAVWWCATALLFLSGCASLPQAVPPPQAEVQFGVYMQITLQLPEGSKQRFFAVWRRLEGSAGSWQDEVEIKNPFGGTEARLTIEAHGALLQYEGDKVLRAENGNALAHKAFGVSVPVEAFRHWIHAMAAPGLAAVAKSKDGSVRSIEQFGWTVEYVAYDAAQRPAILTLHSAELNSQVEVNIRRWL